MKWVAGLIQALMVSAIPTYAIINKEVSDAGK